MDKHKRQMNFDTKLKDSRLVLMDGGLGTTLEDVLGLDISSSPLWSTQPVVNASEAVVHAHLLFLRAGARIISTSTYQCSVETLAAAGVQPAQARTVMLNSVHLAKVAKAKFEEESRALDHNVYIALSLGPFGAILKPTQEFRGIYPPPYGPQHFTNDGTNVNTFGSDKTAEHRAIDALSKFHLDRLLVFASNPETWNAIDFLAFETVPLCREVVAIRKAMTELYDKIQKESGNDCLKPWWISCVFPDGQSPEESGSGRQRLGIKDFLASAFRHSPGLTSDADSLLLTPPGFGINCTSTKYLGALTRDARQFFKEESLPSPWMVVYPNGNEVYNEATRGWVGKRESAENQQTWADEVSSVVAELVRKEQLEGPTVGGIIVGGCCKTAPSDISALLNALSTNPWAAPSS